MYIYKLIDMDTGNYLIESASKFPNININRYTSLLAKLIKKENKQLELIAESDLLGTTYAKFKACIDAINNDDSYRLLNGRVRVDEILKAKDEWYIYTIQNKVNGKIYIDCTRHVLDKLYRTFKCNRALATLKSDMNEYNDTDFKVTIYEPCSTKDYLNKWIELFEENINTLGESQIYNINKYRKLITLPKNN